MVLTFYPEEKWPEGILTQEPLREYDALAEVDTAVFNKIPTFRELIIDLNGTVDGDDQRMLLDSFPKLQSRKLVHVMSVDENQLCV